MKKTDNRILELADLQKALLSTCTCLNRPIRKNQLIKMVTELFECNTVKEVEFALLDLIEQGKLQQKDYFITTPEFAADWNGTITAADEGIINLLKYIGMKYPALLRRADTALAYMDQLNNHFPFELNNAFYAELNDYPANRWFTKFFDSPDCRILIRNIFSGRNYANFQIVLLPGKKKSYKKAYKDYEEFQNNITSLFNRDVKIQVRRSLVTIPFSQKKRK